ncbi:MAG: LD-carboxypeptidase, partial [Nocardioides sp.]
DWRMLTMSRPRWLVGFSDITALHQAVAGRLGVVSAHGPGVAGLSDAGAAESVRHLLFEGTLSPVVGRRGATGGVAEGVLVGGNLTMLASGIGTAFVHSARDSIAVLEDVGERPFRLDRVLTQLLRSGWFEGARGVVCGQFSQCGDPGEVAALLAARLEPLGLPIQYDAPIGHEPRSVSLPLGALARLDAGAGALSLVGGAGRGPTPSASG